MGAGEVQKNACAGIQCTCFTSTKVQKLTRLWGQVKQMGAGEVQENVCALVKGRSIAWFGKEALHTTKACVKASTKVQILTQKLVQKYKY